VPRATDGTLSPTAPQSISDKLSLGAGDQHWAGEEDIQLRRGKGRNAQLDLGFQRKRMLTAQTAKEAIQLGQALPVCPDVSETLLHPRP